MPVKKKPSKNGPVSPPVFTWTGRPHSAPSPYGDGAGTVPGPLEYVVIQGNRKLPDSDPEGWLGQPDASWFWTPVKKAQIRSVLLRVNAPDHIGPTSIWSHLPNHDKDWKEEHKSLAILSMRICLGQFWRHSLEQWETFPL